MSEAERGESGVTSPAEAEERRTPAKSGTSDEKEVSERREDSGGKPLRGCEAELSTTTIFLSEGISGASMRPDSRSGTRPCSSGRLLRPRQGL